MATGNMCKTFSKVRPYGFRVMRADRQRDILITIHRTALGGEVIRISNSARILPHDTLLVNI